MKKHTRIAALLLTVIMMISTVAAVGADDGKIIGGGTGPNGEYLVAKKLLMPEGDDIYITSRYFVIGDVLYDTDGNTHSFYHEGEVVTYNDDYIVTFDPERSDDNAYYVYTIDDDYNAYQRERAQLMAYADYEILVKRFSDGSPVIYVASATENSPAKSGVLPNDVDYAMPVDFGMILTISYGDGGNDIYGLFDTRTDKAIALPEGAVYAHFFDDNLAVCSFGVFSDEKIEITGQCLIDRDGNVLTDKHTSYTYIEGGLFLRTDKTDDENSNVVLVEQDGTVIKDYTGISEDDVYGVWGIPFYATDSKIFTFGTDSPYTCYRVYDRKTFETDGYVYNEIQLLDDGSILLTSRKSGGQGSIYRPDGEREDTDLIIEDSSLSLIYTIGKNGSGVYDNSLQKVFDADGRGYVVPLHNALVASEPDKSDIFNIIDLSGRTFVYDNEDLHRKFIEVVAVFDNDASIVAFANDDYSDISYYFISYHDLPFNDIKESAWYYETVYNCVNFGLMRGQSDLKFNPNDNMSRAELAMVLYRLADEPKVQYSEIFPDVPANQWYTDAVIWAAENGIVNGFEDGTFRPYAPLQRDQMAAIFYRYSTLVQRDVTVRGDLSGFYDTASVQEWAVDSISWAVGSGLIKGMPKYYPDIKENKESLAPFNNTTRAEVATVLSRFTASDIR